MELPVIHVTKKHDDKSFLRTPAKTKDAPNRIRQSCIVKDANDEMLAVYLHKLPKESWLKDLLWACQNWKFRTSYRTSGMVSTSNPFGGRPRNKVRLGLNVCAISTSRRECPKAHKVFTDHSLTVAEYLKKYHPAKYEEQKNLVSSGVLKEWRLPSDTHTSGIVNKNNRLLYHQDQGNFKNSWSVMVVFKYMTKGGIPELTLL